MTDLIATARKFYAELDANNTKEWWAENRATYDNTIKPTTLALLADLTPKLEKLTGHSVTTKLFRPYRDVRFSKDKTPYQTHLHMFWGLETEARQSPVFFFGIGLDYITAGAGIMGMDKPVLEDWRKFADLDTDRVMGIIDPLRSKGYRLREPELKRVPPPYPKEHPAEELLRMKAVTASREIANLDDLLPAFTDLWPLNRLLIEVAEA